MVAEEVVLVLVLVLVVGVEVLGMVLEGIVEEGTRISRMLISGLPVMEGSKGICNEYCDESSKTNKLLNAIVCSIVTDYILDETSTYDSANRPWLILSEGATNGRSSAEMHRQTITSSRREKFCIQPTQPDSYTPWLNSPSIPTMG